MSKPRRRPARERVTTRQRVAGAIHDAYVASGLERKEIAARSGYSVRHVARVLAGRGYVSFDAVIDVAWALGVEITTIYHGVPDVR